MKGIGWHGVLVAVAAGCGSMQPADAGSDTGIDRVYYAPDVPMQAINDACHPLPTNLPAPTSSCEPPAPAGGACTMLCAVCMPNGSAGFPCVCNGTVWVCPADTGCQVGTTEEPIWNGGTPPASCP